MLKRVHHDIPWHVMRRNRWYRGHCSCLSLAGALLDVTPEWCEPGAYKLLDEWAEMAALVKETLWQEGGRHRKSKQGYFEARRGTWWGGADVAIRHVGLPFRSWNFYKLAAERRRMYYGPRQGLPTVAAVTRGMKPHQRAIVRSTGHMFYVAADERAVHVYDAKARARVDHVYLLLTPSSNGPGREADETLDLSAILGD